jgi:hypothetical protein
LKRVETEARQAAIDHFGIGALLARELALEDQKKALDREGIEIRRSLTAAVRNVAIDEISPDEYCYSSEWERAINCRQKTEERRLLAGSPLGLTILRMQSEKEEILDTVWLATSPKQIKDLWRGVAELVSAEPTALQKKAMEVDDDSTET